MEEPMTELEERINSALDADIMPSGDLEALLAEVEEAITAAQAEAKEQHALARDIACTDYTAAHARAVAAELTIDRLQGVVPDLQAKLRQATAQEYRERWLADLRHVEAKRDVAAKAFARYPEIVDELITIFQQAEATDKEVQRVNAAALGSQRLQTVELHARKFERLRLLKRADRIDANDPEPTRAAQFCVMHKTAFFNSVVECSPRR
jgi:hypothetical protein